MSSIKIGDLLAYDDFPYGIRHATVEEVTTDRVVAVTRETGERFDLSRAEIEEQGFAANGSVWDLIFTLDGFEIARAAAHGHCESARQSRSN